MEELKIMGEQKFMDKMIPVVLGGFGEGQKCISDKTIAEIHRMEVFNVRSRITNNAKRFVEHVDVLDLCTIIRQANDSTTIKNYMELLKTIGYTNSQYMKANHIYLLSERGYAKLIKIMDSDLAWEIHDKLIDEYFELRAQQQAPQYDLPQTYLDALKALVCEVEQKEELQLKITMDAPKVKIGESYLTDQGYLTVDTVSKILQRYGVNIGRNNLYAWLRQQGWVEYNQSHVQIPTQYATSNGWLELERQYVYLSSGMVPSYKIWVTPKGQSVIFSIFGVNDPAITNALPLP